MKSRRDPNCQSIGNSTFHDRAKGQGWVVSGEKSERFNKDDAQSKQDSVGGGHVRRSV
jgi:hypothetical protein